MKKPYNQAYKILDNWSNFDYKAKYDSVNTPVIIPMWTGWQHQRRLRSYAMLESYYSNASRYWLEDQVVALNRREYGDPHVIVETAMTSLVGDDAKIVVEGSLTEEDPNDGAVALQEQMDEWATKEKFYLKMLESERQSVKFGDSVYVLGFDTVKNRPRLNVYDPGFYFPVFDESLRGSEDFPTKVHIAYEFEEEVPSGDTKTFVRRITWELVETLPYIPSYASEATTENCLYQDIVIELPEIGKDVNTFAGRTYRYNTEPVYLNIDFIPVVHVPNTVNLQNHYGQSVLAPIMQILDDIQSTDTDTQAASSTTGSPVIVVSGRGTGPDSTTTYGPGTILYVGDGNATLMDTSSSLDALLKLKDSLLERLSVNSRIPESLLGRVKPNEVPSGIALTLSFTPHSRMIREMRLVREEKYCLLFKFVARMMGIKDAPEIELEFGSFLPADKQETMTMVVQLLGAKAISLETGVQMLLESGIPIEDWVKEIGRIQSRDVDTANSLVSLTGDPNTGLEYLGLPLIEDPGMIPDPNVDPNYDPNADPMADPNA